MCSCAFLINRKHKKLLASMSDFFGILESEFRKSFKQVLSDRTGPAVSHEEMIVGHHVEIVVSTRWLVAYMIMHMPPKGGIGSDTREAAATLLKSFFAACAASATTSLSTSPADLPRCMAGNTNAEGACRHVREVVDKMEFLYGHNWKHHQVHLFLDDLQAPYLSCFTALEAHGVAGVLHCM